MINKDYAINFIKNVFRNQNVEITLKVSDEVFVERFKKFNKLSFVAANKCDPNGETYDMKNSIVSEFLDSYSIRFI